MMGRTHTLSGAGSWLTLSAAATWLSNQGLPVHAANPTQIVLGTLVAAGYALLPDIDHPRSTIANALGPVTRAMAWVIGHLATGLRQGSCAHCARDGRGGHRAITHTVAFAAAITIALGVLLGAVGQPAALAVIGVGVWLASMSALSAGTRARIGDAVLPGRVRTLGRTGQRISAGVASLGIAGIAVLAVWALARPEDNWAWLALAVGVGVLSHSLGDAMTRSGAPLWWPVRIGKCRWAQVGTPRWARFTTGKAGELVVAVAIFVMSVASTAYLLLPYMPGEGGGA